MKVFAIFSQVNLYLLLLADVSFTYSPAGE